MFDIGVGVGDSPSVGWGTAEEVAFAAVVNAGLAAERVAGGVSEDDLAEDYRRLEQDFDLDEAYRRDLDGGLECGGVGSGTTGSFDGGRDEDPMAGAGAGAGAEEAGAGGDCWVPDPGRLAAGVPGPGLVAGLAGLDPVGLDPAVSVEVVAAWARVVSWAQAQMAVAAAAYAAVRPVVQVPGGGGRRRLVGVAGPELALRLSLSRQGAQKLISMGKAMGGALIPVGEALAQGRIDEPRARVFVEALAQVPWQVACDVQDAVLPVAGTMTAAQVSRAVAAALIAVDPVEASARHARARATRRVCRPRVLPDGMASMFAVLPAADAVALDVALDAAARTARAGGDERTTDQLRADALAASAHHALASGTITALPPVAWAVTTNPDAGEDTRDRDGDRGDAHGRANDDDHRDERPNGADASDRDERPGEADERGLAGAQCDESGLSTATSAPGSSHSTTPRSDGTQPAAPAPGSGAGQASDPPASTGSTGSVGDEVFADAMRVEPVGCALPEVPPGGFRLGRIGGRTAHIEVTVPLAVLVGQDDPPPGTYGAQAQAESDGTSGVGTEAPAADPDAFPERLPPVAVLGRYGPISPDVARALALGGTWRRLITDPESGVVRDVGRTRYHPPADLADLIRARDRTCVRPGCSVPASACDLDHTLAYHLHGPTAETNLGPLCSPDHALKTAGAYRVTQPSPGTFTFHLTTGHTYTRNLDGTTAHHRPTRVREKQK